MAQHPAPARFRRIAIVSTAALALLLPLQTTVATARTNDPTPTPETTTAARPGSEARALADARSTGKAVEVTSKRTATTQVYANPNGTLTANLHAIPAATQQPASTAQQQMGVTGAPGQPTAPWRSGWALIFSGYPEGRYWNGDGDGVAKVGQCYNDGYCNNIGIARSFFQYDTGWLNGRKILSSSFRALNVYSPSCQNRPIRAWGTGPISGDTRWNAQPARHFDLGTRDVYGGRSGCPSQLYVEYDTTAYVNWSTNPAHGLTSSTVSLTADNEGDQLAWRKFATDPVLSVSYNTVPDVPTNLMVENDRPCGVGANEVRVNPQLYAPPPEPSRGPRLWSTVTDPDGGSVAAKYRIYERNHATLLHYAETTGLNSPGRFSIDVPPALNVDNRQLSFQVTGWDGLHDSAAASVWCDVTIDKTAPVNAPNVSSPTYQECPDDLVCPASGAAGYTGGFAFMSGGDTDVAGFRYTLEGADGDPDAPRQELYVPVGANGVAQTLVTPPDDGPQTLTVRAVDKARNESAVVKKFRFFVGRGTPPVAHWRLDGHGTDTAVVDDSPARLDGVRPAGEATAWRGGRHGDALWFDGSASGFVQSATKAVDTGKSFSVSAWVKLDQAGTAFRTAVSQNGSTISGFFRQYNPHSQKWNFTLPATNADEAVRNVAESPATAVAGRWTHLVGVFDDAAKQLRLYVDGVPGSTASHLNPWSATGPAQLGRAQYQANGYNNWTGSLDEVRLYQRVISDPEIDDLAGLPTKEELFWPFDESDGSTASDASGNYRLGALGTGATRTTGTVGTGAIRLDGSGATVSTTGPVVRTDAGFTVTARVKLDAVDGTTRTVLSQDGTQSSGFQLRYRGDTRRWSFSLAQGDAATITVDSDQVAQAGVWTQLTGIYDHAAGQIRLYVDGEQPGAIQAAQTKGNATGPFRVGAGQQAGQPATQFLGEIDDVHVWTGVKTGNQVLAEYNQPVTRRANPYGGQLARFTNTNGFRIVTNGPLPPGSHYEGSLGVPAPAGTPGTRTIYSCRNGALDYFLDPATNCAGHTNLGSVGQFWTAKPEGVETVPVYRCYIYNVAHFASTDPNCEGATTEFLLGYTKAYSELIRHLATTYPYDHVSSTGRLPGNLKPEVPLGHLSLTQQPGTTAWMQCKTGTDVFSSTEPDCEGKTVVGNSGYVWTDPPSGMQSRPVFRCRTSWNELFDSGDPNCEGQSVDRQLGYVALQP